MRKTTFYITIIVMLVFIASNAFSLGAKETTETKQKLSTETRTVIDLMGNVVEIPAKPKRIGSIVDSSLTVMLHELGADIIGTGTTIKLPENKIYMKGVYELFNINFEDTDYFNYGKYGEDIEQIKSSKPDLILSTRWYKSHDILSQIAPTVIIEVFSKNSFSAYRDLATWVNKQNVFNKQLAIYNKRLDEVRNKFTEKPNTKTFIYFQPYIEKGQISIFQYYGAFTKVAYDLGFKKLDYVKQHFADDEIVKDISAEVIGELNADYIFSAYDSPNGKDKNSVFEELDTVAPGWRSFMNAYKNNRHIILDMSLYATSFKAYHYVLDEIEKYAR